MGKAPIKLTIVVKGTNLTHPEVERLRAMGHIILPIPEHDVYLDDSTLAKRTFVDAALKGARARKKGKTTDAAVSRDDRAEVQGLVGAANDDSRSAA